MNQNRYRWNPLATRPGLTSFLTGAAMLCIAALSFADRQPGSLSTIKTNPSSGHVEIIHRLHNHDAELGIIAVHGDRSLTLDTLMGRAQLALYVEEHFRLATMGDDGIPAPLELDLVGAEVDGEFVLVYQEFSGTLPVRFAVRDDILRDVFPEQVNHVNIAVTGGVRSLIFKGDDDWHIAE
jgi:hypothetical protein